MRGQVPDEVPPHWLVYFAVDDADATAEKAKELGGGVAFGPMDIPVGRFAVLTDPHGAVFASSLLSENRAASERLAQSRGRRPPRPGLPASPSSSQSAGSPRLALFTTLRPSIAHFIRVAEMSIPSSSRTNSFGRRSSSSRRLAAELVGEQRGRRGRDRAALALEGDLGDPALVVEPDRHVLLVAAERVGVLELEVGRSEPPEVVRPLVVLEDLVAVELVHAS